jgi:hypothetical protein
MIKNFIHKINVVNVRKPKKLFSCFFMFLLFFLEKCVNRRFFVKKLNKTNKTISHADNLKINNVEKT